MRVSSVCQASCCYVEGQFSVHDETSSAKLRTNDETLARFDVISKIEKELTEIVQDETRELDAIDLVEAMKVVVNKQHAEYIEIQTHFLKISADYNATKQQYDKLDIKLDNFWRTTMKQQVDSRFALREKLTREEWKKLYKEIN